jgi:hypothetical protein
VARFEPPTQTEPPAQHEPPHAQEPPPGRPEVPRDAQNDRLADAPAKEAADEATTGETFKRLREAKGKFNEAVVLDLERLLKECQEVVRAQAAATADPVIVKGLLEEVEKLKTKGAVPVAREFDAPSKRHLEFRRSAARALFDVYQTTVADLTKALQVDNALQVKDEMDEFVDKERKKLGVESADAPAVPTKTAESPALEPEEKTVPFSFDRFLAQFVDEVERVAKLETGAKRFEQYREMMDKFDDKLKSHTLRFHFPIREVTPQGGGRYVAHLDKPDEAQALAGVNFIGSYALDGPMARDATRIRPGDVLELSGKPRLSGSGSVDNRPGPRLIRFASIQLRSPFGGITYPFYLQSYDARIRKQRDPAKDDDSDETKAKARALPPAMRPVPK